MIKQPNCHDCGDTGLTIDLVVCSCSASERVSGILRDRTKGVEGSEIGQSTVNLIYLKKGVSK